MQLQSIAMPPAPELGEFAADQARGAGTSVEPDADLEVERRIMHGSREMMKK